MDYNHFIAGSVAGTGGVFVGYPYDNIRVKLQTQKGYNKYRGVFDCFFKVLRSDGLARGIYKGLSTPLIANTVFKTTHFGVYGNIIGRFSDKHNVFNCMMAGTTSSLVCGLMLVPTDRIKIILQTHRTYKTPIDVIKSFPVRELYKVGFGATMCREAMFGLSYFPLFQTSKRLFQKTSIENSFISIALSGGFTGCASWSFVYPFDVVKSKIQSDVSGKYKSVSNVVKSHYKREGVRGFYKGWTAAVYRAFPTHATVLGIYQTVINKM
jgi:solute carrier family 25 carnitine/acylcarnitine transporter 20/29